MSRILWSERAARASWTVFASFLKAFPILPLSVTKVTTCSVRGSGNGRSTASFTPEIKVNFYLETLVWLQLREREREREMEKETCLWLWCAVWDRKRCGRRIQRILSIHKRWDTPRPSSHMRNEPFHCLSAAENATFRVWCRSLLGIDGFEPCNNPTSHWPPNPFKEKIS